MDFEWDVHKAQQNTRKHGIQFADAVHVLEDDSALTTTENASHDEERWITLGVDAWTLVVVYTWRTSRVRIISARPATPGERYRYAEGL